jgi:indole-3-glycerol phosphate synthase
MRRMGGSLAPRAGAAGTLQPTVATYLDRILAAHRAGAAADGRSTDRLRCEADAASPARDFAGSLAQPGLSVIAEIKRRSPSKGDLAPDLVPAVLAQAYAAGGAAALSVLTDHAFFAGSPSDLAEARSATSLPVLRKDFTVCEADVCDARIMGADAVLLIVAALDQAELAAFAALAAELGLVALIEVHDEAELERALAAGCRVVGVNQRDLVTFDVDINRAERVAAAIPPDVLSVAESGIRDQHDARRLADAGFDAVLVGETLVRSADPAEVVRALREAAPCS